MEKSQKKAEMQEALAEFSAAIKKEKCESKQEKARKDQH